MVRIHSPRPIPLFPFSGTTYLLRDDQRPPPLTVGMLESIRTGNALDANPGEPCSRNPSALDCLGGPWSFLYTRPDIPYSVSHLFTSMGLHCGTFDSALPANACGTVLRTGGGCATVSGRIPHALPRPACIPRSTRIDTRRFRRYGLCCQPCRVPLALLEVAPQQLA